MLHIINETQKNMHKRDLTENEYLCKKNIHLNVNPFIQNKIPKSLEQHEAS